MDDSNCALDGCRRPPSRDSSYCWVHKFDEIKERKEEAREAERVGMERMERRWRKSAGKAAKREAKAAKAKHAEAWKKKEPKLRAIAEEVFSNIESFRIDLDDGELRFSADGGGPYSYDKSLTRTFASIRSEMEDDKNRPAPSSYHIPRCSICGVRPVQARVSGVRHRYGDVCMSCDDDEC